MKTERVTLLTTKEFKLFLRAEAQRQPLPLSRLLGSMAASGTALRGGNAKQQMVAAYNGTGGPASLCALAVNARYPFVVGATAGIVANRTGD